MAGAPSLSPTDAVEKRSRRDAIIHVRVPQQTRDLITTAAASVGKTVTDFVLESARRQAIDVLLDQRLFELNDDQHEAFTRALDEPPQPTARLKELFSKKAPWEK